jgi:serine/threonine protein kinase
MRQPLVIRRGRYALVLPIGEGRLTRSYLAVADGANQPVVVKRLRPELAHQPPVRAAFTAAADIGKQLHHAQIAETYEVFPEADEQLLAMEYLEGQTLADLVQRMGRARMPLEEHLWVLSCALAGLAHCHALVGRDGKLCGGNHREASSSNIMITYEGDVKVVDFALQEAQIPGRGVRRPNTQGIGPYAPEQLCGLPIDARSDVFAMGVLLWEALARRPRAVGEDRAALIAARVAGSEPGVEVLPPELPRALVEICARATALDPAARFAGPAELLAAFEAVRSEFSRAVGPTELAALVARNFKLERDALRRRINEHLENVRAEIRLRTPQVVVPQTATHRLDHDATIPGLIPSWFDSADDDRDDADAPPPPRSAAHRVGIALSGLAALAVVFTGISFLRRGDPASDRSAARPASHDGVAWTPIESSKVALERPLPSPSPSPPSPPETPALTTPPTRPAPAREPPREPTKAPAREPRREPAKDLALEPTPEPRFATADRPAAVAQMPMRIIASPTRSASLSPPPSTPPPASPPSGRRAPVQLLDANGTWLSVARPATQPAAHRISDEPGRGLSPPARRQLDEQDPYR